MARSRSLIAAGWLVVAGLLGTALVAPTVTATKPDADHKVTICHRTNSDANPYRMITVDIASSGHLKGGHNTQHQGPIWEPGLKDQKIDWGDIIPPYTYGDYAYPGANWSDAGQAIWTNDCDVVEPSPSIESVVPSGSVEAETGAVEPTPPATDATGVAGTVSGTGLGLAFAALAVLMGAALAFVPARIRR